MKLKTLIVLTLPLLIQASGLESYYDFEDMKQGSPVRDQLTTDLFGSLRPASSGEEPAGVADVPKTISSRSRVSLSTQGGFVWIRNAGRLDIDRDMTVNFWFKTGSWKNQRSTFIISLKGWRIFYNSATKCVEYQDVSVPDGKTVSFKADLGKNPDWNMLTLVKNGSEMTLYLNSKKIETAACDHNIPAGGGFYIGAASTAGGYAYVGLLDDFALWSSPLPETWIEELYKGVSPMDLGSSERLERTVTTALPDTLKVFFPPAEIALVKNGAPNAVIVAADTEKFKGMGEKLQRVLSESWGVKFPVMSWQEAKETDKNLILFGAVNASEPLRRLDANFLLGDNRLGYELRTIPEALDWKKGVLYIGGKTEPQILEGAGRLLSRFKDPAKIPFFIECQGWDKKPSKEELDGLVAEIEEKYRNFGDMKNQEALEILNKPVKLYKMTGYDEYAATFAKMQKIYADNYQNEKKKDVRKLLPTFTFHLFPQYIYNMENSPSFTAEDRLRAAEIMRQFAEDALAYWEMTEAIQLYQLSKQSYLQNHECFASRSVEAAARYLLTRYQYAPAKYWKAVADNAFAGVAPHPFSPEDAGGYQYLVYRIFMDYAMASGKYSKEFFKADVFKEYIDTYAKPQFNHLGYTAGFGDANVTGMRGGWPLLKQAMDILEDQEAEYLLSLIRRTDAGGFYGELMSQWDIRNDLPPPGEHTWGLNLVELKPFKQKRYQLWGLFKQPALDKAILRSGWDAHADFMAVTGISDAPHGHFDANGISQYISGNRLWLMEGDYIKKFPYNHNSIVVSRDGTVEDQRYKITPRRKSRASQITAAVQTPDRKLALLSLLLEDYNGVNWTRNICYAAKNGFWVIDELDITKDGHYAVQCYWRSIGKLNPHPQTVELVQSASDDPAVASHFFITEGSGATRVMKSEFEASHGRKNGNLTGYQFAEKFTRFLIQRRAGEYKKGDKPVFVNFMQAVPGESPATPVVHKLAPGAFLAESGGTFRLAVMGAFSSANIEIDAELCFVGPEGIVARGAKRIKLGDREWSYAEKQNVALECDPQQISGVLGGLKGNGEIIAAADPSGIPVPELSPEKKLERSAPVTKIAGCGNLLAVGDEKGLFSVYDQDGNKLFDRQFPKAISAVSAVQTVSGVQWAVAVHPEDLTVGSAGLYLLDSSGGVLWTNRIEPFHDRYGTVTTLFTAKINGQNNPPAVIAGSEDWHYYAFSSDGKEIWRTQVTHGATVGAAGDMNGDGTDDIASGAEYYYHAMIDNKGTLFSQGTASPLNYAVAVCDLDGNGVCEAVFGRGDSFLYVATLPGNEYSKWNINVGGKPAAIVELPSGGLARLAAATDTGLITFIDGSGKKTGVTRLPAPVTDMKLWDGKLLAVALDGYAYVINLQGGVEGKIPFQKQINSIYQPGIAVSGKTAALFSGSEVYLLK